MSSTPTTNEVGSPEPDYYLITDEAMIAVYAEKGHDMSILHRMNCVEPGCKRCDEVWAEWQRQYREQWEGPVIEPEPVEGIGGAYCAQCGHEIKDIEAWKCALEGGNQIVPFDGTVITPVTSLYRQLEAAGATLPCGHPSGCEGDGECGWCADVARLVEQLSRKCSGCKKPLPAGKMSNYCAACTKERRADPVKGEKSRAVNRAWNAAHPERVEAARERYRCKQ
jgi:hypothetical protein